jgi:hypothetical protein
MACLRIGPYFSVDSDVYHVCSNCAVGNNIETDKRRTGAYGRRKLCERCKDIIAGKIKR